MKTPWGESTDLRSRKMPPGRGTPRDEAGRNHRERLFAATVALVNEKGYEATRIADLVKLSGISRSAFYRQFADKQECFLTAAEELTRPTLELMERAERVILLEAGLLFDALLIPILWIMLVLTAITAVQRFVHVWKQAVVAPVILERQAARRTRRVNRRTARAHRRTELRRRRRP